MSGDGERALAAAAAACVTRSPDQHNGFATCDAEIVTLASGDRAAFTCDTLVEEIQRGILRDPFTIGWIAAVASIADIAAAGAQTQFLLDSIVSGPGHSVDWASGVSAGIDACAQAHGSYLVGGDIGVGAAACVSTTAIALYPDSGTQVDRRAASGSQLIAIGEFGMGNAVAARRLLTDDDAAADDLERSWRPIIPRGLGQTIGRLGGAMIDSSDGLAQAVVDLHHATHLGMHVDLRSVPLDARAQRLAQQLEVPDWALLIAGVGDYQFVAALAPPRADEFAAWAHDCGVRWQPVGYVADVAGPVRATLTDATSDIDLTTMRSNLATIEHDPVALLQAIRNLAP